MVGGHATTIEEHPWIAYVQSELAPNSRIFFTCSGAVVAPRLVLTAGHCAEDLFSRSLYKASSYRVTTGVANIARVTDDHVSRVSRVLLYPGFHPSLAHGDAALLILSKPVTAPPLPLATAADDALIAPGAQVEIAGWGLVDAKRDRSPRQLQAGILTAQLPGRCRRGRTFLHFNFSATQQLCLLDTPSLQVSGCFGDSGGPATSQRADGSTVEVGIISGGGTECQPREPNILTRADLVSPWVSEWIAAVETGAPEPEKAVLAPRFLILSQAKFLALHGLVEDFAGPSGKRSFESKIAIRCQRIARSSFLCRVAWRRNGYRFFGGITVEYIPYEEVPLWRDQYEIHWVSSRCLRTAASPRSCRLTTRRLFPGKPKRLPRSLGGF